MRFFILIVVTGLILGQALNQISKQYSENSSLIAGGYEVNITDYRFAVKLTIFFEIGTNGNCAGAALSTKVVLTAGHCLIRTPKNIKVYVGLTAIFGRRPCCVKNEYDTMVFKVHEDFNPATYEYDIALVGVKIWRFRLIYKAAKLPEEDDSQPAPPMDVTLLGWGSPTGNRADTSNVLRAVRIPVVNHRECVDLMKGVRIHISRDMFCAGDLNRDDRNAAYGDSGGPVVSDSGVLVGIISGRPASRSIKYPSFHVDVAYVREWIIRNSAV